jgi:glucose uptake protein GlcU
MIVMTMLLIVVASTAFAAHQWWRGHHLMAIGFITLALLISGVVIQTAKNNQSAEASEALRQP